MAIKLKNTVIDAANKCISEDKPSKNDWFDNEYQMVINERDKKRLDYLTRPTRARYDIYRASRTIANRTRRRKNRAHANQMLGDVESHLKNHDTRQAFKRIRHFTR